MGARQWVKENKTKKYDKQLQTGTNINLSQNSKPERKLTNIRVKRYF